jgi:Family of unknown function (DUF5329)
MRTMLAAFALVLALSAAARAEPPALPSEDQKIDALIAAVGELRGAVFVRNGSEYDGQAAANHLRLKRQKAGSRVKTADDFIRLCGSSSSMTGQPYEIRYADGRSEPAEVFLRARLAKLEGR